MIHEYEAVIVGAGGAGLYAALEASRTLKTAVLSKVHPIRSHTGTAQGGISAALGNIEEDRTEWHAFDTVKGGDYLVDQTAAEILAEEAVRAVYDLENRGLPFNRTPDGRIDQRRFGGHTRNFGESPVHRSCYAADRTGHMILQTLYQQCIKNNVSFFNEFLVLDAIVEDSSCGGVIAYEIASGELHTFRAKAVLFATGGFGRMYRITSNAYASTGDGIAVLARRGVPMEDMEFFQFHPTGIRGMGILITEGVRGEGGFLRNRLGERFMERYSPVLLDLAPRDIIARAMITEMREGRGLKDEGDPEAGPGYLLLDATHLGRDLIEKKLPDIAEFCRTYLGLDPAEKPIPVQPTAHYAMGGIPTDTEGRVLEGSGGGIIRGLYAAGECACVSVHGANRLGTNSLVDLVVFGRRAGRDIESYAKGSDLMPLKKDADARARLMISKLLEGKGRRGEEVRRRLESLMMERFGIFRNGSDMKSGLEELMRQRESYSEVRANDRNGRFNMELVDLLELGNLLDCALLTAVSALNRTESRGAHSHEDYPERDDKTWLRHTLSWLDGDTRPGDQKAEAPKHASGIVIRYKPVDIVKWKPKPRKY